MLFTALASKSTEIGPATAEPARGPCTPYKLAFVTLDAHGDAHAAADAQGGQALLGVARCISCKQRGEDARARGADGVADGDGAAVDVDLAGVQPSSLLTASAWAAKASLASIRSRSATFQPAFSSALREAGIGPVPMTAGSTPAVAQEAMRASGFRPRSSLPRRVISTTAAAPSLRPEALAAVTVPSLSKAGRSRRVLELGAVADVFVLARPPSRPCGS